MKKLLLSAIMIAAMTSCSQKSESGIENEDRAIKSRSSISYTKAEIVQGSDFDFKTLMLTGDAANDFSSATVGHGSYAKGNVSFYTDEARTTTQNYEKSDVVHHFVCLGKDFTKATDVYNAIVTGSNDILFSQSWSAGKYSSPITSGLIFKHALAQIEVSVSAAAGHSDAAVKTAWGDVTAISVTNLPNTVEYTPSTNAIKYGTTSADLTFLDDYNGTAMSNIAITSTGAKVVAMVAPFSTTTPKEIVLNVKTTKNGQGVDGTTTTPVTITLANDFIAGKKYGINLTFSAANKVVSGTASTVTNWETDGGTNTGGDLGK